MGFKGVCYRCQLEKLGNKLSEYLKIHFGMSLGYIIEAPIVRSHLDQIFSF